MMEKNLRLNEDKCVVITIGTKKQREETKIQLKTNAIMCGKFEMKQAEKKNGWASKYQQEASQNLSPKQLQQKRGK